MYIQDENLRANAKPSKRSFAVDNFYSNPHEVRKYALEQEFFDDPGYIGRRTRTQHFFPGVKEAFSDIIGKKVTEWESYGMNGRFQHNWAGEKLVYHCDSQMWAGMVYLTPDAPLQTGTAMIQHKENRIHHNSCEGVMSCFNQKTFVDKTPYEVVDDFSNVFNRLVIFHGGHLHAASGYFGNQLENCRMWHMFFFDTEE